MEQFQSGALIDTRPPEEKKNDPQFKEVVASANPVVWVEKPRSQWRKFPIQNQDGSGSCVAQTMRKIMGVYIWLKTGVFVLLSATHIYKRRRNRPAGGMGGIDAFEIAGKGVTLEQFVASENMSDAQMDAANILPFMEEIGKIFKIGKPLELIPGDIETVASIIQTTGKAVMTWFYFAFPEWQIAPKVLGPLDLYAPSTNRHSQASVDFTLLGKSNMPDNPELWGKKALITDESWGFGTALEGQRVITEDWFKARNFFAAHFMNFAFEDQTLPAPAPVPVPPKPKPQYTFKKDLEFNPEFSVDPDVKALQDILKYEGCLSIDVQSSGWFGVLTREAVQKYQLKRGIVSDASSAGYGRVGPKTRGVINAEYGIMGA